MQGVMRLWIPCVLSLVVGLRLSSAAPRYIAYDLGAYLPVGINDAGDIAATAMGTITEMVRLRLGEAPTPSGVEGSVANAINATGLVVGYTFVPGQIRDALVWREDGGLMRLPEVEESATTGSNALGVNSAGDIVGASTSGPQSLPVVWRQGQVAVLSNPPVNQGGALANAITDSGDIIGRVALELFGRNIHAVLWPGGGPFLDLDTRPRLAGESLNSVATALTSDQLVVGNAITQLSAVTPQPVPRAFLWTAHLGMQLLPLAGEDAGSQALAINEAALIVGQAMVVESCFMCGVPHATLWEPSSRNAIATQGVTVYTPVDLTAQLDTPGWTLSVARDINKNGWIIGEGVYNGNSRAFLLVPDWTVPAAPIAFFQEVQGDFNGDGVPDRAGIDPSTQIWVCLAGAPACTTVQGWGVQMVAGDLDGNGMDDLAVVAADTSLWVRLNGWSWQRVNGNLTQMVMGNFFGDGRQYLAGLASDTSIWVNSGLWPNGPNQLYGDWHQVTGFLSTLVVGDFTGSGRDQLAGCAVDTSLWFAGQVQPAGWMPWQQLPGYLVTMETVPGTPDTMQGVDAVGQVWCAPTLGAWQPCPGGTLVARH